MSIAGVMETSGRVAMFVWRCTKKGRRWNACLRASEEVFPFRAPARDATCLFSGTMGGESSPKAVKRAAMRRHRGRDVRERGCKNYLCDMFLDLILS